MFRKRKFISGGKNVSASFEALTFHLQVKIKALITKSSFKKVLESIVSIGSIKDVFLPLQISQQTIVLYKTDRNAFDNTAYCFSLMVELDY